ncbi:unnamed protein product [Urochloa decumbens]|uniref:Uncharacterized protein n=1 Tax=Urochloa decumbens TaxID=240449 RepID=A0ABC9DIR8_9POAL
MAILFFFFVLASSCSALQPLKASYCYNQREPIHSTTEYIDTIHNVSIQLQKAVMSTGMLFSSITAGVEPNVIHGLALCRMGFGGLSCSKCVQKTANVLIDSCKIGITYDSICHVVLSNNLISPIFPEFMALVIEATNTTMNEIPPSLSSVLFTLVNKTSEYAANHENRMASSSLAVPGIPTFYSYMQCTPDLSKIQCIACFSIFPAYLLTYFIGHNRGAVVRERCTMVFGTYQFYKGDPMLTLGKSNLTNEIPAINLTSLGSPVTEPPPQVLVNTTVGEKKRQRKGVGNEILKILLPVAVVTGIVAVALAALWGKNRTSEKTSSNAAYLEGIEEYKSLLFDPSVIRTSTGHFSEANKLGEGGFGVVYKGLMPDGMEIAVKRLTGGSKQAFRELKNELVSAAKLQHRNLVNLMGASIDKDDMTLVYEFVPNKTLDAFIFDEEKRTNLSWDACYKIICGITRGLVYLHNDCHLRVIHSDLKPSNILLEADFNPKISDFGLASVCEGHSNHITRHRGGSHGYIAPERIIKGESSQKSDVFSFGIIILEILAGRRNNDSHLLIEAWESWITGTMIQVLHPSLHTVSSEADALKCLQIALLCAQVNPRDRPSMSTVITWLQGESVATMPTPSKPRLIYRVYGVDDSNVSCCDNERLECSEQQGPASNKLTVTDLDPR